MILPIKQSPWYSHWILLLFLRQWADSQRLDSLATLSRGPIVSFPLCTFNGTICQASPPVISLATASNPIEKYLQKIALEATICSLQSSESHCLDSSCSWNSLGCTLSRAKIISLLLGLQCDGSEAHFSESCRLFGSGGPEQCSAVEGCTYIAGTGSFEPPRCLPTYTHLEMRSIYAQNQSAAWAYVFDRANRYFTVDPSFWGTCEATPVARGICKFEPIPNSVFRSDCRLPAVTTLDVMVRDFGDNSSVVRMYSALNKNCNVLQTQTACNQPQFHLLSDYVEEVRSYLPLGAATGMYNLTKHPVPPAVEAAMRNSAKTRQPVMNLFIVTWLVVMGMMSA